MKKKFSDEDLQLLLNQGLTQAEIARKVGVSEQAVSWRVKRLRTKQTSQAQDLPASSVNSNISIRNQLNLKELKFLEFFLSGEHNIKQAMVLAGFGGDCHPGHLYWLAKKIVKKYERQAQDAKEVLRACGVGEVRVAKKLDALMDAPSERTQLGAAELAAKCLRMTSEPLLVTTGVQIIIRGQDDDKPDHAPTEGSSCRRPSIRFQQEVMNKRNALESLQIVD